MRTQSLASRPDTCILEGIESLPSSLDTFLAPLGAVRGNPSQDLGASLRHDITVSLQTNHRSFSAQTEKKKQVSYMHWAKFFPGELHLLLKRRPTVMLIIQE